MPLRNNPDFRAVNTCKACRQKKIRCSRERPSCAYCQRRSINCIYDDRAENIRFMSSASRRSSQHTLGEKYGVGASLERGDRVAISADQFQMIKFNIARLQALVNDADAPSINSTQFVGSHPSGLLVNSQATGTRYVGATSWATATESLREIGDLLASQEARAVHPDLPATGMPGLESNHTAEQFKNSEVQTSRTYNPFGNDLINDAPEWTENDRTKSTQMSSRSISAALPSRPVTDMLVEAYIQNYHPIVQLIHVPSFRNRYEEFWLEHSLKGSEVREDCSFAALLAAMIFAGACATPKSALQEAFPGSQPEAVAITLFKQATHAVRLSNFPKTPSMDSLAAYMITQQTWTREEEPLSSCAFVGILLRVAQILGLHRDPSSFGSIDRISAEVRRRVWWQVVFIDVCVAVASGLPPIIDLSWDVREVSDLKEEFIDTVEGAQYDGDYNLPSPRQVDLNASHMIWVGGIFVRAKYFIALTMRRFLSKLYDRRALETSDITEFVRQCDWLADQYGVVSARLTAAMPSIHDESYTHQTQFSYWARLVLYASVDKCWIVMCMPMLKSLGSQISMSLYSRTLHHSRQFLYKLACLSTTPGFHRFYWNWPGVFQGLHAITLLVQDLVDNPFSATAAASRDAVNIIFSLRASKEGGVIGEPHLATLGRPLYEGGQETWQYLSRLRDRAWRIAGLDPDAYMAREEAADSAINGLMNSNEAEKLDDLLQYIRNNRSTALWDEEVSSDVLPSEILGGSENSFPQSISDLGWESYLFEF